jgi:peptidoglycan/xylan/chitin deacetylase (PgdA/CDA1 family)
MNIPIIMLHHIGKPTGTGLEDWSITAQKFSLLLDLIEQKGLKTTTLEEIVTSSSLKHNKLVILSFDDCPNSLFEFAIPELLKRKMKAVFSIPTEQIGGFNQWDVAEQGFARVTLMNAAQLQYLSSLGMEIASHGKQHLRAGKISEKEFAEEIAASKQSLEKLLNKKIYTLTYPYGEVPKNHRQLLKEAGYEYGLSIYQPNQNAFALRRIGIHQSDTAKSISFKLSQNYQLIRAFLDPLLSIYKFLKA